MPEPSFERIQIVGELALHPFQVAQTWTIRKLIKHPSWNQIRNVLLQADFFGDRTHGFPLS